MLPAARHLIMQFWLREHTTLVQCAWRVEHMWMCWSCIDLFVCPGALAALASFHDGLSVRWPAEESRPIAWTLSCEAVLRTLVLLWFLRPPSPDEIWDMKRIPWYNVYWRLYMEYIINVECYKFVQLLVEKQALVHIYRLIRSSVEQECIIILIIGTCYGTVDQWMSRTNVGKTK